MKLDNTTTALVVTDPQNAFLMMQMFLMPLFGFAPTMSAPPRMIGAIASSRLDRSPV